MFLDSKLRFEIISSLLGKEIKPCNEKNTGTAEDILSVDDFHLHNVIGKRKAARETFVKEEDFFEPAYDCDFTQSSDRDSCTRGNELYERPKGWYRIALKVNGKYPDGDTWLGIKGWRNYSVPGEWPVSYHGTSLGGAKGIIRSNYSAGDRAMYGRGIYSTPDIHVAESEEYAKTFTSKSTGKSYKVILQNRINPKNREICKRSDYWLVRVNRGTSAAEERAIVESSIRPYGILIKEVEKEEDEEGCRCEESASVDYGSVNSDDDGSNHGGCDDDDDEDENYDDDDAGDDEEVDDIYEDDDNNEEEDDKDDGDTEGDEDGDNDEHDYDDDDGVGEDGCDDGDSCGDDADDTIDDICDNSDADVANESGEDGGDNELYSEDHEDYDDDDDVCADDDDVCRDDDVYVDDVGGNDDVCVDDDDVCRDDDVYDIDDVCEGEYNYDAGGYKDYDGVDYSGSDDYDGDWD